MKEEIKLILNKLKVLGKEEDEINFWLQMIDLMNEEELQKFFDLMKRELDIREKII